jgi:hypothetical protein
LAGGKDQTGSFNAFSLSLHQQSLALALNRDALRRVNSQHTLSSSGAHEEWR